MQSERLCDTMGSRSKKSYSTMDVASLMKPRTVQNFASGSVEEPSASRDLGRLNAVHNTLFLATLVSLLHVEAPENASYASLRLFAFSPLGQVRGLCVDLSNLDIFDRVSVYGDITDCDIHHMWYGMYRYVETFGTLHSAICPVRVDSCGSWYCM